MSKAKDEYYVCEYKLRKGNILKDGHTMFLEDVIRDLKRKAYLENYVTELEQQNKEMLNCIVVKTDSPYESKNHEEKMDKIEKLFNKIYEDIQGNNIKLGMF